jgi:hypothetical protein
MIQVSFHTNIGFVGLRIAVDGADDLPGALEARAATAFPSIAVGADDVVWGTASGYATCRLGVLRGAGAVHAIAGIVDKALNR